MDWLEKNGENKKERYNKRNLRSGCFSGLEKPGKECVDIGVEDFSKGNKFRYLDVHTVIHIWSDFLHDKVLSFLEYFAIKKLYIDFTGFTFYNVS